MGPWGACWPHSRFLAGFDPDSPTGQTGPFQVSEEEYFDDLFDEELPSWLTSASSEEEIIELLKDSSLKRPEKLAKVLEQQILSKRSRNKFVRALVKQKTIQKEVKKLEKKQKPLHYFFKQWMKNN